MGKMIWYLLSAVTLCYPSSTVSYAALSPQAAAVLDMSNASRNSFTNTERIVMQQRVSNDAASSNRIVFRFKITNPSGATVFEHYGNAAPGSVGNSQTQVAGVSISEFYAGPGIYRLLAEASLDGQTVQQQASFTVSSPNVTLTYPPNGARDLTDSPVTFRWVGSGASKYRVTVDDDPSFYNAVFIQETSGPDESFTYPQNPSDQRQRLAGGQIYYWKVEGLDFNGNKVSESGVPFNFSIQSQAASLTRDLAVTELSIIPPATASTKGNIPFRVTVKNQGGTNEADIQLRFTLGGLPASDSPKPVSLGSGESREFTLTTALPPDLDQGLAIACLEIFDDNVPNNCKTLQIRTGTQAAPPSSTAQSYSPDEMWDILRKALSSGDIEQALQGYQLVEVSGLPPQDLNQLLLDISQGRAKVTVTTPPETFAETPSPQPISIPGIEAQFALPKAVPIAAPEEEEDVREWSGWTSLRLPQTQKIVIRQEATWKKFWPRLSREAVPKINFKKYMVVGVLAGAQDLVAAVQVRDLEMLQDHLLVRYDLVGAQAGKSMTVPYHLKVVTRSENRVEFRKSE